MTNPRYSHQDSQPLTIRFEPNILLKMLTKKNEASSGNQQKGSPKQARTKPRARALSEQGLPRGRREGFHRVWRGKREVVSSAERRKSLQRAGVGRKKEVGKRHYVEGSRRWLKTHSLFSLSLNYSILLTIQITLFFIRSRKLIRDALILLSFFRGESVVMEKA